MSIIIAIIVFSVIIIVHELGHFFAAKKCGIRVEEFSVGMGPLIVSKKRGETEYSLRAFPIGGYCKMQGEMDDEEYSDMVDPDYEKSRSFNQKSVMQKIGVIFAGPAMNFVLAFILVFILLGVNGFLVPEINSVVENSPAYEAGLQAGCRGKPDVPAGVWERLGPVHGLWAFIFLVQGRHHEQGQQQGPCGLYPVHGLGSCSGLRCIPGERQYVLQGRRRVLLRPGVYGEVRLPIRPHPWRWCAFRLMSHVELPPLSGWNRGKIVSDVCQREALFPLPAVQGGLA